MSSSAMFTKPSIARARVNAVRLCFPNRGLSHGRHQIIGEFVVEAFSLKTTLRKFVKMQVLSQ